jgi:hypothetical protein
MKQSAPQPGKEDWIRSVDGRSPLLAPTIAAITAWLALWLLVWWLARLVPFGAATWIALLVLAGWGGAGWWRNRHDAPFASLRAIEGRDRVVASGLFLATAVSAFASSTPLVGFSEHALFHVPLVASMQRGNIPPIDLKEPDGVLYYHYAQHLFGAMISELGRTPSHIGLFLSNALHSGFVAVLGYAIARCYAGIVTSLASALLLVAGGTLNWVSAIGNPAFAALMNPLGEPFTTGNVAVGSFLWRIHGNSMAWAMCLALVIVVTAVDSIRFGRARETALAGIALAALGPANETLYCALLVAIGVLPFAASTFARRVALGFYVRAVTIVAVGVAGVFFTGGVMETFFKEGSATHGAEALLELSNLGTFASWNFGNRFPASSRVSFWSLRFAQDVGPIPYLTIPALIWACLGRRAVLFTLCVAALAALLASSVVTLSRYPENMFRLVTLAVVLGALPVGVWIGSSVASIRSTALRRVGAALAGLLVIASVTNWPLLHVGILASPGASVFPAASWPADDSEAIAFLKQHTRYVDRVLAVPHESTAVLNAGQASPLGSFVGGNEIYRTLSRQAATRLDLAAICTLKIDYLYVDHQRTDKHLEARIGRLVDASVLEESWRHAKGTSALYRIRSRCPP